MNKLGDYVYEYPPVRGGKIPSWLPAILRPDYTWPSPNAKQIEVTKITPPVPRIPCRMERIFWGFIHRGLIRFGHCTSLEEALMMQMADAGGIPTSKVLCCGEHPAHYFERTSFSILMTRLPGTPPIDKGDDTFDPTTEDPWLGQLGSNGSMGYDGALKNRERAIRPPILTASAHRTRSEKEFHNLMVKAKKLYKRPHWQVPHRATFTHGDLRSFKVLVKDGRLTGIVNWQSGGWYPEYWEYVTILRSWTNIGGWWREIFRWMGGDYYARELDAYNALVILD
ncbi:hypothetical protein MGYG_05085 [Nannizzia gypsea CBS 118893]|uniref:Aminoglycoside phosphotransferase domain-containing protein n=1 Tax=Arthroderma gypseum (strain ATCC MYA-4604 / CBS 118893) TaxID=535722 RepID=E4UYB9_ARTGP|nr:hypothetical protein MGYG_05085 [Nannizzia gypsea CBS 118893]EFR02082.1 hypothetical protein MGYG_05085 [Nannizzia gypsea CBS 118893]